MKYLKLYENFNPKMEENLEDIKWIMIELDEYANRIGYIFDGNVVTYKLDKKVSEEALNSFKKRLNLFGYDVIYFVQNVLNHYCMIVNMDFLDIENKSLDIIQKELLFRYYEKTPNIIDIHKNILYVIRLEENYAMDLLYEFLGTNGVNDVLDNLLNKKTNITDGGYNFNTTLDRYEYVDDTYFFDFSIHNDGYVNLMNGDSKDILDAMEDSEIGWEIGMEMQDSICAYVRKFTGIPSRKLEISLIKDI